MALFHVQLCTKHTAWVGHYARHWGLSGVQKEARPCLVELQSTIGHRMPLGGHAHPISY